jgi:penicillin-binding protein 1A
MDAGLDRLLAWAVRRRRAVLALGVAGSLVVALAVAATARGPLFFLSCDPAGLAAQPLGQTSTVHGTDGTLLVTIAPGEQWRPVELADMSPSLQRATTAIEDRRFHDHRGVDYRGLLRALVANVEHGEPVQGGSTITQQLARTLYLGSERTYGRKVAEACIAVELERRWTKERILQTYLNRIYYGRDAHGAEAAARTYFSKPAAELTLAEAALLAGLAQAPSQLDPVDHPEAALERRDQVLAALAEIGDLDERELAQARRAPLGLNPSPAFGPQRDAYLASYVQVLLVERYGEATVRRGGLRVRTTIDPRLQQLGREAIARTLDRDGDPAAALVAVEPETGAVRAMVAVVPGEESIAFNYAADGRRQAGSAFKTFALAEAVGRGVNPWETEYLSAPFRGPDSEGEPWQVSTYDHSYAGRVSLAEATLSSDNTAYARLIVDLGADAVLERARAMGIRSELPAVPSIVLGSGEVSVLEMASAYATLANQGGRAEPTMIEQVAFPDGRVEPGRASEERRAEQALPAAAAYHVTRVLERVIAAGTGTGAQIGRPAAGKTGTTDDHSDAWFAGYTPQLAAAVWIGFPERLEPMTDVHGIAVAGGTFPASIWQRFMSAAHEGLPVANFPAPAQAVEWKRFCGRVQFARTMADARPEGGCPEPVQALRTEPQTATEPETAEKPPNETQSPQAPPPPTTTEEPAAQPPPPPPPDDGLVGGRGKVVAAIPDGDVGEVEVRGERRAARSEDGAGIAEGTQVEVVAVEGDRLVVRPRDRGG